MTTVHFCHLVKALLYLNLRGRYTSNMVVVDEDGVIYLIVCLFQWLKNNDASLIALLFQ